MGRCSASFCSLCLKRSDLLWLLSVSILVLLVLCKITSLMVIATCLVGEKILEWLLSSYCEDLHDIQKSLWTCPAPYPVLYYFSLALHKAWCWTSLLIPTGVCSQDRRAEKMRRVYEISRILNDVVDALLREADPGDADALQYSNVSSPVARLNLVLPNQDEESFAVKFGVHGVIHWIIRNGTL